MLSDPPQFKSGVADVVSYQGNGYRPLLLRLRL